MAYLVREADIHQEKETLLRLLTANRERSSFPYDKRYDWLYRGNPFGEAIAWIIYNEKTNLPVGFTAVYPRKMLVRGKETEAWNCGDFSIDRKYRTLGIALKLRKAAKQWVDEGKIPFLYAHPNDRMVHIHLKAGHHEIAKMKRFALLIDVSKILGGNPLQETAARVLNPILKGVLKFKHRKAGEYEFRSAREMEFDHRYREICEEVNRERAVIGLRDDTYLHWKFSAHPVYHYQIFNYFQNNRLKGYIIFTIEDATGYLTEIVCEKDVQSPMISTFINAMIDHFPQAQSLSTIQQEFNPIISTLADVGFRYRDDATSSVIAYTADSGLAKVVLDGRNWFMNVGDRDA